MYYVGLNKAEVVSLRQIDPTDMRRVISTEEVGWATALIKKTLANSEVAQKADLHAHVGYDPDISVASYKVKKTRTTIKRSLIARGFELAAEALKESDPVLNNMQIKIVLNGSASRAASIMFPIYLPSYVVTRKHPGNIQTRKSLRKFYALVKYVLKIQRLIVRNQIPAKISCYATTLSAMDNCPWSESDYPKLEGLSLYVFQLRFDQIINECPPDRVTKDLTFRPPGSFSISEFVYPGENVITYNPGSIDIHGIRSTRDAHKIERITPGLVSTTALLYLEQFQTIIKTLSRVQLLPGFESTNYE